MRRPVALVILDGWGVDAPGPYNAVTQAHTPRLTELFRDFPSTTLGASGLDVGLPDGQMGNSEVGHLNLGAGRIVYQDLTRISKSISDGDFYRNPVLLDCLAKTRAGSGRLHLCGLLSDGGVHSHNTHLYALVELARREGIKEVLIHPLLDGRDTPPSSAAGYLEELEEQLRRIGCGRIASICGRFYAMDRDNRWERVEKAWRMLVQGEGVRAATAAEAIAASYAAGVTDEFVLPTVIGETAGIQDGDGFVFFNFRSDRAREITRALTFADFDGFSRPRIPQLADYVCMTEYDATFPLPVAYPPDDLVNLLGDIVARAGMTQLRIAETEKYAHVTFFFNGGNEKPASGEERVLIPSPKDVATYDQKPAMSAAAVTDAAIERIAAGGLDLMVLNYANPDMVGHTGILPAAVAAMETVDSCLGRVVDAILEAGGSLLVTADHGNCERMADEQGQPHTAHTSNRVPLLLIDPDRRQQQLRSGILADIAPTLLVLLGLSQPTEMTGRSLFV